MRLIDADKLKEVFAVPSYEAFGVTTICSIIDDAPTVDAEPVRLGKWEVKQQTKTFNEYMTISGRYPTCNLCGFAEIGPFNETNYCPNCGAKMQGEKDDE